MDRDERLEELMSAVVSLSSTLDTSTVLERLVEAGCHLTGARYGALGVLGDHGGLAEFVHRGIDDETTKKIGALPTGRGVLGHLSTSPHPIRLHDLADHEASTGFPEHHPAMHTFLGVPVRARGEIFGNLYLTEKHGTDGEPCDFTAGDEQFATALAAAAGVAVGHARAYRRAREHELWLEAAAACSEALTSGINRDDALDVIRARVLAVAEASAVALYDDELPPGLEDDLTWHSPTLRRMSDGADIGLEGPVWVLAVPLRSGDRWVAALTACWPGPEGDAGPQVDLPSVAGFAEQLALSLDVAEAHADRARLAVLEERERIARDLHDMVIQRLFAIGLDVQGAAQDAGSSDVARRLSGAVDDLDETIKDVRTTIFRLGARGRSTTGLRHAIDAEVVRSRQALGFLPRLRIEGVTATVPDNISADAVAVTREALANVARHARAREVVVRLFIGNDLLVEVQDDGVGIPVGVTRRSGLANLEERARRRGGSVKVVPVSDGGTLLAWSVPLHAG